MVTPQQLREHIGRRPFRPFRVVLTSGEAVEVTRVAQAVAMERRLVYADDNAPTFRWIPWGEIDRVESGILKAG
ncbi:MAG TPA: hypothetical protein VK986_02175 [Tepidisphaeraceae bacterium]|nr:hypothetical protein [Tepidisphaeraceae bacterium]